MKPLITAYQAALLLLIALGCSGAALAARPEDRLIAPRAWAAPARSGRALNQHLDGRFAHNQYYFNPGYRPPRAPGGGVRVLLGTDHFLSDHGNWYRRDGIGWVAVAAPIGALVPFLPQHYTTIWFGGAPYYYANDGYYTWSPQQSEYQVVKPPAGIETQGTANASYTDTALVVYPEHGQSTEQQRGDEYDCYRFATQQTGFDPLHADGRISEGEATTRHTDYVRADSVCLAALGYSVD